MSASPWSALWVWGDQAMPGHRCCQVGGAWVQSFIGAEGWFMEQEWVSETGQVLSTRSTAEEMFFHADARILEAHCVPTQIISWSKEAVGVWEISQPVDFETPQIIVDVASFYWWCSKALMCSICLDWWLPGSLWSTEALKWLLTQTPLAPSIRRLCQWFLTWLSGEGRDTILIQNRKRCMGLWTVLLVIKFELSAWVCFLELYVNVLTFVGCLLCFLQW